MDVSWTDNSVKNWQNLPINNPKPELRNINAHIKFGENPLNLLKLSSGNKNTDGWTYDRQMDSQSDTLISRHFLVAGYKKYQNVV